MKRFKLLIPVLVIITILTSGVNIFSFNNFNGENKYDVNNIPAGLKNNAGVVVRNEFLRFEVKDESRAVEIVKKAVTIFKKSEQDYGKLYLWYDKFSEIDNLEGTIYDSEGNEVRDLEDNDIKDYPAYSDYSLYEDNRVKIIELYYNKFPYTIEYTYKINYNGFISWPSWYSRNSINPVEHTRFEVAIPKDNNLRYWCSSDSISPSVAYESDNKVYYWEYFNLPKLPEEAVNNAAEDYSPVVKIAPGKFMMEDHYGEMNSWKSFGKWFYDLTIGKDDLPDSVNSNIKKMITGETDVQQKINKLYKYMQSKTRYVSVQLGIGGWQPFDASYVNDRGYGDCKALSNYMISILKQAGINSYPVLIRSGSHRYNFIKKFPSNQFNHVIVSVPLKSDTVWLECTSQTMPFGHLSWSTENRNALMVTPDGGVVVKTPSSSPKQNIQKRIAEVTLNSLGIANAEVSSIWSGDQQDRVQSSLSESTPQEIKKYILNLFKVPNIELQNFNFDGINERLMDISLNLKAVFKKYANNTGKRMFFNPNLMDRQTYIPAEVQKRLSPVRYNYPFLDVDSIYYTIPDGFSVESLPSEINIQKSFGSFHSKTEITKNNKILYTRNFSITNYEIPPENYNEYRDFNKSIVKSDRAQVVLIKEK